MPGRERGGGIAERDQAREAGELCPATACILQGREQGRACIDRIVGEHDAPAGQTSAQPIRDAVAHAALDQPALGEHEIGADARRQRLRDERPAGERSADDLGATGGYLLRQRCGPALDRPRIHEQGVEVEPEIAMVAGLVAEVAARRHGGACGPIEQDLLDIREHVH